MGIRLVQDPSPFDGTETLIGPRIFCDACDEEIVRMKDIFLFHPDRPNEIFFAHVGACADAVEGKRRAPSSHHLTRFFDGLLFRLKDRRAQEDPSDASVR